MRITLLTAIALATLTATASAQTAGPAPVPVTDFPPVAVEIAISDAAGNVTENLSCEWTEPQDDDRQCLRFQGDPQTAFAKIEESGGVRADQTTTTRGETVAIAYSKRADGTWLIRAKGTVNGRYHHAGRVCTADGQKCVRWDAEGAKSARRDVKAAASKLRRR
jgi:hypothetical protein